MISSRNRILARLKSSILVAPVLGKVATSAWSLFHSKTSFKNSTSYWEQRYARGGNSGSGSYNRLAEFKAETLNTFVKKYQVADVIEFGCGDGNQLRLAEYPRFMGFDVSSHIIESCKKTFAADLSKSFKLTEEYTSEQADLSLSIDVIYHLVEDPIFEDYMHRLFRAGHRFVVIYSSNNPKLNDEMHFGPHVKHRKFTDWVTLNAPEWELFETLKNHHPYSAAAPDRTSLADFYFYRKAP